MLLYHDQVKWPSFVASITSLEKCAENGPRRRASAVTSVSKINESGRCRGRGAQKRRLELWLVLHRSICCLSAAEISPDGHNLWMTSNRLRCLRKKDRRTTILGAEQWIIHERISWRREAIMTLILSFLSLTVIVQFALIMVLMSQKQEFKEQYSNLLIHTPNHLTDTTDYSGREDKSKTDAAISIKVAAELASWTVSMSNNDAESYRHTVELGENYEGVAVATFLGAPKAQNNFLTWCYLLSTMVFLCSCLHLFQSMSMRVQYVFFGIKACCHSHLYSCHEPTSPIPSLHKRHYSHYFRYSISAAISMRWLPPSPLYYSTHFNHIMTTTTDRYLLTVTNRLHHSLWKRSIYFKS